MKILRLLFISGFILVSPVLIFLGYYSFFIYEGMILPGISVHGIPVHGLTQKEAVNRLDIQFNQSTTITLVNVDDLKMSWQVTPVEFGLSVDAIETAETAFTIGRQGSWIDGLDQMLWGIQYGHEVEPVVKFNRNVAEQSLYSWSQVLREEAQDADLQIVGGTVQIFSGESGKLLDIQESLDLISSDPKATMLEYQLIPLVLTDIAPNRRNVDQAEKVAKGLLLRNLEIRAFDPVTGENLTWSPPQEEIGRWLQVGKLDGEFQVSLDQEQIMDYLIGLNDSLGDDRYFEIHEAYENTENALQGAENNPLQIHYKGRNHVVLPWETLVSISFQEGVPYWKLLEANPEIEQKGLQIGRTIDIPAKDSMLELPVIHSKRIVISIPEQKMWLYQDGQLYREHIVSTGISRSPTMPGIFQVKSRYENAYASIWDLYMPHFLGIYNATPNLENGIHGLPLLSNGARLWANVLGQPASYGCIILDLEAAEELYEWAEDGVVVEISGDNN